MVSRSRYRYEVTGTKFSFLSSSGLKGHPHLEFRTQAQQGQPIAPFMPSILQLDRRILLPGTFGTAPPLFNAGLTPIHSSAYCPLVLTSKIEFISIFMVEAI